MNSREAILGELRIGRREQAAEKLQLPASPPTSSEVFGDNHLADSLDNFRSKVQALKGQCEVFGNKAELAKALVALLALDPGQQVLCQRTELLESIVSSTTADFKSSVVFRDQHSGDLQDLAGFSVGITEFDCAISRTGSLSLRSTSAGGRVLSVLPPTHVAIGTTQQVVPSIEDWLNKLAKADKSWSFGTLISGPSRTADIEKILVFGAHGPKRLIVLLLDEPSSI